MMLTSATCIFEFWTDRWLLTLFALLMSAFVLAEQNDTTLSYDELMKDTIFGSSRNWRTESTTDEYEWRAEPTEEQESLIYEGASKEGRLRKPENDTAFTDENDDSIEQPNLFKIDL